MLVSYAEYEGSLATRNEKSNPDWKQRLRRATAESKEGKRLTLDTYLKRRSRR